MSERDARGTIREVAIAAKIHSSDTKRLSIELGEWLRRRDLEVALDPTIRGCESTKSFPAFDLEKRYDLVVVLGGDGTLLSVARAVKSRVPILGVNLGNLGFMTEIPRSELYPSLVEVLAGRYDTEERSLLTVRLERSGGRELRYRALNDAVITKSALARIIELTVQINGHVVATYRSDGLIVSTPTGSTAYNLSAGGPIVFPGLPVVVLTPICPQALTMRPLVVPDSRTIEVTLNTPQEEVFLTVDGQEGTTLEYRDRVLLSADAERVSLVKLSGRSFYDALRDKLHWGE